MCGKFLGANVLKQAQNYKWDLFKFSNEYSFQRCHGRVADYRLPSPLMVDAGFVYGNLGTELVGISSSILFLPIRNLSKENNQEILANE